MVIKILFIGLLLVPADQSNYTMCVSLSNRKCETQPILINLNFNEYSQEYHCHSFSVKLDRYAGSSNTNNDFSNKAYVPNKAEDLNPSVFNLITRIN